MGRLVETLRGDSLTRSCLVRGTQVLRLRSHFASRSGYFSQDDNLFFDLNATCPERLPFLRELSPPTMATNRSSLVLDTPSLLASSSGVFSAKLICTFLGTVILQSNCTPAR